MSTIRTLLFMKGDGGGVISSIDVTTVFLPSTPYGPDDEARYVHYTPHPNAPIEYYQLMRPIYGQRSASLRFYKTMADWLHSEWFESGENEPYLFVHPITKLRVVTWVDDLMLRVVK